jgi:hypothetical protein
MKLLSLVCSGCEKEIQSQELAVIIAYLMIHEDRGFSLRTTDLFHKECWNRNLDLVRQGTSDGPSKAQRNDEPPATP